MALSSSCVKWNGFVLNLARFVFSCSWVSRIVEKATDEDGGEHAIEVDCQAIFGGEQGTLEWVSEIVSSTSCPST